jgi:hypothetical protein
MKIECNQLRDMDSGLTIPVEKIDYKPDDQRARLGVVTFTLDTGERLEFQLVKDGHSDVTLSPPEKIRFMEFEKVVQPMAKENHYFLVYWVYFDSGNVPTSICGARFNCFMRRLPAEKEQDDKQVKTPKKHNPVTIEEAALICNCSPSCIKAWERGKSTPPNFPGRNNEVTLRSWQAHRNAQKIVKAAVMNEALLGDGKAADIATGKLWNTEHAAEVRRKNR